MASRPYSVSEPRRFTNERVASLAWPSRPLNWGARGRRREKGTVSEFPSAGRTQLTVDKLAGERRAHSRCRAPRPPSWRGCTCGCERGTRCRPRCDGQSLAAEQERPRRWRARELGADDVVRSRNKVGRGAIGSLVVDGKLRHEALECRDAWSCARGQQRFQALTGQYKHLRWRGSGRQMRRESRLRRERPTRRRRRTPCAR